MVLAGSQSRESQEAANNLKPSKLPATFFPFDFEAFLAYSGIILTAVSALSILLSFVLAIISLVKVKRERLDGKVITIISLALSILFILILVLAQFFVRRTF